MQDIKLTLENVPEIIQRAYTYLASKYDKSNRSIIDYTCKFTYTHRSFDIFSMRDKQKSSGFLFVNADSNQHYFFLPSTHLIIECNNGQFRAFPLLKYAKDEKYCLNIINEMFSSFDGYDFRYFDKFNQFRQNEFNIELFKNELDGDTQKVLEALLDSEDKEYNKHYDALFPYWFRYFFNLPKNSTIFCNKISFDIDLDLSHKEDFYFLERDYFNEYSEGANLKEADIVSRKTKQLSNDLEQFLDKTFSPIFDTTINTILNGRLQRFSPYYFKELAKMSFFIPFKGKSSNGDITYFSRISLKELSTDWMELKGSNLSCVTDVSFAKKIFSARVGNTIYTISSIHQDLNLKNFSIEADSVFDFSYNAVLVFGYKAKVEFMRKYVHYQLDFANNELISAEQESPKFNLSKEDFLKKMEELYCLLNKTNELRILDHQRFKNLIDDYITKMDLDSEIHVI